MLRIAVIGGAFCDLRTAALAEEVGREIARQGAILICGGLGGVMEAACRGAKSQGGLTVGILPGTNPSDANPYVDIPIVTGMGEARNVIVVRSAHAVVAIAGEYGTLSEIAYALKFGIPVVGLKTWELFREGKKVEEIIEAENPKEAVEKAIKLAKARNRG
ncbi:MAG: TIGR00725 family protein [Anaerolineae bacterium]|nr:TIGR00725 family protein [Anaerolineae bacterium]